MQASDYSWHELVKILPTLYEQDAKDLLDSEIEGYARPSVLKRLHQRYSTLRNERERAEIMRAAGVSF